ncbi:cytochrome P450, partial [Amylostereum chailletii]
PPLDNWLLGHFIRVLTSEPGALPLGWAKQYGPVVRTVGPVGRDRLFVFRPEALHKILATDWTDYPRPKFMRDMLGLVAGYGLLTVTGNEHKQMRKAMNPAFSLANLMNQTDMYFDSIHLLVDILNKELEGCSEGRALEMYTWMSKVTLDIICDTAFGYSSEALTNPRNELTHAYEELINLQSGVNLAKFTFLLMVPGMPTFLNSRWGHKLRQMWNVSRHTAPIMTLVDTMHRIRALSRRILREKIAEDDDRASKKDIMSLLVRARRGEAKDGYQLNDDALVDQVLTFLGAGHETTASGLSWALWLLATHPEAQDKLRAEVAPVFARGARPDYRAMKDLPTLEGVIMESLRLFPPVPITLREAAKSDWVDGTYVPKGTMFYLPIRAINTWTAIWGADAEEFKPERWRALPETYSVQYSLLSFIAGPHACIGRTMAVSEMKAVLAAMVANFEFKPAYEGQGAKPVAAVTMKPADNMPLWVTPVSERVK